MVFCNQGIEEIEVSDINSHNPYFNRWFSAILKEQLKYHPYISHNPYFNRWFSAIRRRGMF